MTKNNTISYCVTCFNEIEEIQKLLPFLIEHKREEDNIVVLWDSNGPKEMLDYLVKLHEAKSINLSGGKFDKHFANWKNQFFNLSNKDFLFFIDADEIPNIELIKTLPDVVNSIFEIDVFLIPRENYVTGIEKNNEWGWEIDDKGRNCWPDYQWRVARNNGEIKYKNKVHEVLDGYKTFSTLPAETEYSLLHIKTLDKQKSQNKLYSSL